MNVIDQPTGPFIRSLDVTPLQILRGTKRLCGWMNDAHSKDVLILICDYISTYTHHLRS